MQSIKRGDTGEAVEDVQSRLVVAGLLTPDQADGVFGPDTEAAVNAFRAQIGLPATGQIDDKVWASLVDASYTMGDRTLYLRMPYFHGQDVRELQQALGALGFTCGAEDGIFGAHTEYALRKFQMNLALYADGIAGAQTFSAIRNLKHSWEGKPVAPSSQRHLSFSRAADVLESHTLCVFGTQPLTRSVAARLSNLSLATNPNSRIVSAESLLVTPDADMVMLHVILPDEKPLEKAPVVLLDDEDTLAMRIGRAFEAMKRTKSTRIVVQLPSESWETAGEARTAQHYAITLLDAVCVALSE